MIEVFDAEGNAFELPLDNVDDISALPQKVEEMKKIVGDDNWKSLREKAEAGDANTAKTKITQENLEKLGFEMKEDGTVIKKEADPDAPDAPEAPKDPAQVYEEKEAEKVEKKREKLVKEASSGDENKKKVIQEKYDMLKAGRNISDEDEMKELLGDAIILANKGGEPMSNPATAGNTEAPGGTASGPMSDDKKSGAIDNLTKMGYKFKGDPSKL